MLNDCFKSHGFYIFLPHGNRQGTNPVNSSLAEHAQGATELLTLEGKRDENVTFSRADLIFSK